MTAAVATDAELIRTGATALGIELGSTRIKACLVDREDPTRGVAVGSHDWENSFVDRLWTYSQDEIWHGLQSAYAALAADVAARFGETPTTFGAIGVSAMMHGYLALDAEGQVLAPFRTWRNTNTADAATELSELFGVNIPLRWSVAHWRQAVRDAEEHVGQVAHLTTLAGLVHAALTGQRVLGVGDASGMFPIGASGGDYDETLVELFDALSPELPSIRQLLPTVLRAGEAAGELTEAGAALLDPTGALRPGVPLCAPEGDAGTGMVATGAVAPRTGNVSAGTSIFAMVVLEKPLSGPHDELDLVTTPAGDPVAMVHCNNGASELGAWAALFVRFAEAFAGEGVAVDRDRVFEVLFREALAGSPDAGGLLAYNQLSGEPIAGLSEGRPLFVRTPDSDFTLANTVRSHLYGVFATLALGMRVLDDEGVALDRLFAHGGIFRTAGVAQRILAGALNAPVAVGDTAAEGGAWGIAVLAAYLKSSEQPLPDFLAEKVFATTPISVVDPDPADVAGFAQYLDRYRAGLAVEAAAVAHL